MPVGGVLESRQQMCLLKISVTLSDSSLECGRASSPRKSSAHREGAVWACGRPHVCTDGHVCAGECACRPLTLTQRVSWAQGLGGHAVVHGQIEGLLHFGPDDSEGRKKGP